MIRRLNYTGRVRIVREDVHVTVIERKGKLPFFKAELDLAGYGLPGDAKVYVEAYRQTFWMRFDFGSVGRLAAPEHPELSDFDSLEGILFRVRVTSSDGASGKLLAEADQIRGRRAEEVEENREPCGRPLPRRRVRAVYKQGRSGVDPLRTGRGGGHPTSTAFDPSVLVSRPDSGCQSRGRGFKSRRARQIIAEHEGAATVAPFTFSRSRDHAAPGMDENARARNGRE